MRLAECRDGLEPASGSCSPRSDDVSSNPPFGRWSISWSPGTRTEGPYKGGIDVRITAGANVINAWTLNRGRAEFYVLSADVPTWGALGPIFGGEDASKGAGNKGGPLFLNLAYDRTHGLYSYNIQGYLLYQSLQRTVGLQGYLSYSTGTQPVTTHGFRATLEVVDTPDDPACSAALLKGQGSCTGTFTSDSTAPFRGEGGSFRWDAKASETTFVLEAPSGSTLTGKIDGTSSYACLKGKPCPSRAYVASGTVPEWSASSKIGTVDQAGQGGVQLGPLALSAAAGLARTFNLDGYLQYGTAGQPATGHPFFARLFVYKQEIGDPPCNHAYLTNAGGCYGIWSLTSDYPFRDGGGSLHWNAEKAPFGIQTFATTNSNIAGIIDGARDRFKVTAGSVGEWGATTAIVTGTTGQAGTENGPLRLQELTP